MSHIEQLVKQYCPNGVEYKTLGEVANIVRGASPRPIQKYITTDSNGIPWIKIGDVSKEGKYVVKTEEKITVEGAEKSRLLKKGDFILSNSMSFGRPYILGIDGCIHDGWIAMSNFQSVLIPDFLYHLLRSQNIQKYWRQKAVSGAVSNLNADIVRATRIPVPPLPVQEEIVKILDAFTSLEAELEAELEARKKQYEYYRNQLLSFDENTTGGGRIKFMQLSEVCNFYNGKGHEKSIVENGKYIVVNSKFVSTGGSVKKYSNEQLCPVYANDILMVMSDLPNGKALAKCFLVDDDDKYTLNQRICRLENKCESSVTSKFLYYIFDRNAQLLRFDNGCDQTNLRKEDILKIIVPIPTLDEQKRIVAILDKFDSLVNDISEGLPAEINARKQQYEHYRNKLLSFEEAA